VIHQVRYNLLDRGIEQCLLDALRDEGIGCIAFSPLAQGLLTDRYLGGAIPEGSRASKPHGFLKPGDLTPDRLGVVDALDRVAQERGQTLAQMGLAWVLRHAGMALVLIGTSRVQQIDDAVAALQAPAFDEPALRAIDAALTA
jgi:L-glyceraldehyde 3-phosphate reductase